MNAEQQWAFLQDPDSGPWEVIGALSEVSLEHGQDIAEFNAWLIRLAEIARLNAHA